MAELEILHRSKVSGLSTSLQLLEEEGRELFHGFLLRDARYNWGKTCAVRGVATLRGSPTLVVSNHCTPEGGAPTINVRNKQL